ncbi:universal stress protein [Halomonas sp. KAO]|uniref:universal stress protein n=1 Tax=unclassified Halomonas TaxID=2609666 RepID=UPI00189C9FA7|nr:MULTISPECIES: universal stress protein [unclassified Halomonas]MBF7053014.1 universal stress protein [Halomonas sp. KAO]MDT0500686.1 universal stress protein [Halomonas sp. PAR7]MDT0513123.1 universal stress protein [Halomonas sp. LES1]MDT0591466.1 universal stress protein [Halomonas sp. PAR8]
MTEQVMAAIDGSKFSEGVCDYGAWASQALNAPLTFLHVNDNHPQTAETDLSGNLGLGAREHLLEELAQLEEKRAKVAQEQGRLMLKAARERAVEGGVSDPGIRQRNGTLVETLEELQEEIRLLVVGKRGETAHQDSGHLGSNLERVVRSLHRPILMVPDTFRRPEKVLLAFDGSKTTRKGVEMLARSPLFDGVPVHVMIVGAETGDNRSQLEWALKTLGDAGHEAEGAIRAGEVEATLRAYQEEQEIDLLVMGAYGHSRIRHLLVGSTTTAMLRNARGPVLLLR